MKNQQPVYIITLPNIFTQLTFHSLKLERSHVSDFLFLAPVPLKWVHSKLTYMAQGLLTFNIGVGADFEFRVKVPQYGRDA